MKEVHYKKGQPTKYYEEEYAKLMKKHDILVKLYEQCEEKEDKITKLHHAGKIEDEEYFRERAALTEKYEYIADSMEQLSLQAKELEALAEPEEEEEEKSDALSQVPEELREPFLTLHKNVKNSNDSLKELIEKIDNSVFADEQAFIALRDKANAFITSSAKSFTIVHLNIDNPKIEKDFLYVLGMLSDMSMKYLCGYYDKLVLDKDEHRHGNYKEYQKAYKANGEYLEDAIATLKVLLWDVEEKSKKYGLEIEIMNVLKDN